jgi:hypothetical protein
MATASKQIYIPSLRVDGSFVEEVGGTDDRVVYPGEAFTSTISAADFSDPEEYHTVWIAITRAVRNKLNKNTESGTS